MNWLFISFNWYIYLLLTGLIFYPLTKKILKGFRFDFGFPFSKTLAIIFISYLSYVLSSIHLLPFTRASLFLIIGIFIIVNGYIFLKENKKFRFEWRYLLIFIVEEGLFFVALAFWTYVRSQEPSIHSLEKFMDFGFINSILRSRYFPPADMWYTPLPINYYYFGHLTGAVLIKISDVAPQIGYNLILATIFAQGVTETFSFVSNIIFLVSKKIKAIVLFVFGIIGAYLMNLGGNLHTIYVFTTGYPNDKPIPFWKILSGYNPTSYWYPNATRFIPFTIHEFPSYSYVVADLHGHVFDIPFVILTLAILFLLFTSSFSLRAKQSKIVKSKNLFLKSLETLHSLEMRWGVAIFIGFMTSIHYMTNAFDGPIYVLLTTIIFFIIYGPTGEFIVNFMILVMSFLIFSLPFSLHFSPFVSGIGVNCSPQFLINIGRIGPFLFEADKCQRSPFWMLLVLWGFFWLNFILLLVVYKLRRKLSPIQNKVIQFMLILFSFSTFLLIIPEFFYVKDIYPQYFRANTMFKLGYQAFIMMMFASTVTLFAIRNFVKSRLASIILSFTWLFFAFFVTIYPFFSIPSYYGPLDRPPNLRGMDWINGEYPEDFQIINYLNKHVKGQPVILEAQGDSYTDYERISAMTGLPTVAGWWVHEWLWRGSPDVVGKRIPDVETLYESHDIGVTEKLIQKYQIKYVIVSRLERQKYPNLDAEKFPKIGKLIFESSNGLGALYQVNP